MKNLLLVDYSNTVLRSLAVNHELTWNGICTGGLYGFITQLTATINKYNPTHIVVCKDSPPYFRKQLYPDYKEDRKATEKPSWYDHRTITYKMVDKFLELVGIIPWESKGHEADDLIAHMTKELHSAYDNIYILSNDDDLYQLLGYQNVTLLKKAGNMNYPAFKREYPMLEPQDWIQITAMTGTHNAVKGIERCGLKTAIKWFEYELNTGLAHKKVMDNRELIERNKKLIQLPLSSDDHPISSVIPASLNINTRKIIRYMSQYGINYTGAMDKAFSQYTLNQTGEFDV